GDANGVGNGRMTPLEAEIARLETELRSKLGIFEADSPTIKFLQAQLERLKSTDPITASGTTVETEDDNGAGTLFELQIAEIDSQIDALDEETKRINEELETLNDAIERTPRVAIKLDGMEREYEATQSEYQEAVRDRSTARQGVDVESAAKGERVVLIENADVPSEPSSPNRVLIAGGGLFMGSAIAGVFFVLTELLNSAIRRPIDLTKGLGVQPLAVIPYMEEASVRRRRRILKIAFLVFVIVSIPFGLWSIHTHYLPLDLVLEMVLEKAGL
ncbi:MAG: lipopolysaccharide biosynthesis, partial [Pseudomonadota bacterium]